VVGAVLLSLSSRLAVAWLYGARVICCAAMLSYWCSLNRLDCVVSRM
jgi:hypothetical protein